MQKPKQLQFTSKNQADIQAYLDYVNIVGANDNAKLMSEQEFEAYKKNVVDKRKNRLYPFFGLIQRVLNAKQLVLKQCAFVIIDINIIISIV